VTITDSGLVVDSIPRTASRFARRPQHTEVSNVSEDRLPPGHVERRAVSNEVLAFQLTVLQEAQTTQSALLRDLIKEGFADQRQTLEKHSEQISEIKIALAAQDARTTALEQFRAEVDDRERKASEQAAKDLQTTSAAAGDARMFRLLAGIAVTVLTLALAVIGTYAALH